MTSKVDDVAYLSNRGRYTIFQCYGHKAVKKVFTKENNNKETGDDSLFF